jgi:hypothetical protein
MQLNSNDRNSSDEVELCFVCLNHSNESFHQNSPGRTGGSIQVQFD